MWTVVNVKEPGTEYPVLFQGTYDECVDWIGKQADASEGFYQLDTDPVTWREENRS